MVDSENALLSIIEIATCPVCFSRLCNSPSVCVNGHAVCSDCDDNLSQCPICSASFSQEKHTILSQILEALPFICGHKGCSILTRDLVNHEKWCGYRPTKCERCAWSGPAKTLKAHVTSNHKLASNDTDKTCHLISNFRKSYARLQHDQVFWEITRNNPKEKLFSIQLLWVPNGDIVGDVFQMKVKFASKETSYVASTRIKFDPENSLGTENCLIFHKDIIQHFEDNGSLSYKLYLTKD
ncbi:E3 ubiquitin-protein ligase sina-like [Homalodisca vitripennis]|uniref:E3 ubiquitin-protein ligase sina-like n=1 Tax=Homalodisca vitripennis TaxID=197043 RepID=UPI001EEB5894|nr:E3 ubiquitin-protein ligase sina-like [Homalodisca vitripennis]